MLKDSPSSPDRFRKVFLLVLVLSISAAFMAVIQTFIVTILLAAIFTALARPLYRRVLRVCRGNKPAASGLTLLATLLLGLIPLGIVLGLVVNEALRISTLVGPQIQTFTTTPSSIDALLRKIPHYDRVEPYREQIIVRATEAVSALGNFLVHSLSDTTLTTVSAVFQFFIMLYTMFFLLMDGPTMLQTVMHYLPLREDERDAVLDRFVSVTRATLKGTLVIGVIQGVLSGIAFWMAGIQGAIFWGTIMIVLSVIPAVGGALVWVPACLFLLLAGETWRAIMLAVFCALVVGSVDNILRPRLVGHDTKMHDLLILFSTLGGIIVFGALGFIIGPILAALFLTVWEIFGRAYKDELPAVSPLVE